jgi:hypothetical protein
VTLPDEVAAVLPEATREAWPKVAAVVPDDAVLMGGTALAVHLHHRISRDLDLFTTEPFDPDRLADALADQGAFAATTKAEGTLNGVLDGAKVQVLWARDQHVLEPPTTVAGMRVGSLVDLLATKVKVVGDRGELRDYVDLLAIEEHTGRTVEEGIALYLRRYGLDHDHPSVRAIVTGLGWFDDVAGDPLLEAEHGPGLFDRVRAYWQRRQLEVIAHLDRQAASPPRRPEE